MNEKRLIGIAQQYLNNSEQAIKELFDPETLAITPRTKAGRAIIAFVKAEKSTGFALAAGDEFEAMKAAVPTA